MVCRASCKLVKQREDLPDVDATLKLSEVKPLHAKWIVQMFKHLQTRKDLIFNGGTCYYRNRRNMQ